MSSTALDLKLGNDWAEKLEKAEARRSGLSIREARAVVAERARVAPGTLSNLRNGRLKKLAGYVRDRLKAAVIRELEAEVMRIEHELQILKATGEDPRSDQVQAVVASRAAALEALGVTITVNGRVP